MAKVVKVQIVKQRNAEDTQTKMVYPQMYKSAEVSPFIYQEEGAEIEYCLGTGGDGYTEVDGITIVTNAEAIELINAWVDGSKALTVKTAEEKQEIKDRKINCLPS